MIAVFIGPTILKSKVETILDAIVLPPAKQGDIYNISRKRPDAIILIDGYFDKEPAVSHKEILWTMAQGIHVFGCSSMGALRAAELHDFGMKGYGEIFESYLNGIYEDDDEVALVHGSREEGYRPLSEPMVNIRKSFKKALDEQLIDVDLYNQLTAIAKSTFYPHRRYSTILEKSLKNGADSGIIKNLASWLRVNQVDQKLLDSIGLLNYVKDNRESLKEHFQCNYYFEQTGVWSELAKQSHNNPISVFSSINPGSQFEDARNYDENVVDFSVSRSLMLNEAERLGISINEELLFEQILEFRRRRNLTHENSLDNWLKEKNINLRDFFIIMEQEAKVSWMNRLIKKDIEDSYSMHKINYLMLKEN